MPLTVWNCVLSYKKKNNFSENRLVFARNYFQNRFPGSNLLLLRFLAGGKWDFQMAILLPATVNFEPWFEGFYSTNHTIIFLSAQTTCANQQ